MNWQLIDALKKINAQTLPTLPTLLSTKLPKVSTFFMQYLALCALDVSNLQRSFSLNSIFHRRSHLVRTIRLAHCAIRHGQARRDPLGPHASQGVEVPGQDDGDRPRYHLASRRAPDVCRHRVLVHPASHHHLRSVDVQSALRHVQGELPGCRHDGRMSC